MDCRGLCSLLCIYGLTRRLSAYATGLSARETKGKLEAEEMKTERIKIKSRAQSHISFRIDRSNDIDQERKVES